MITTIIILLAASWSAAAISYVPAPGTCKLSLDVLYPACFPPYSISSEPTPACCEAAAALGNKISQVNLCYCLQYLQTSAGAVNITPLVHVFSSCDVSVKLPPVPIPEDMDCTKYVLDGDSSVAYWALVEHPSVGFQWQLRVGGSTFTYRNDSGNNTAVE